jgi:hypothetical protein
MQENEELINKARAKVRKLFEKETARLGLVEAQSA